MKYACHGNDLQNMIHSLQTLLEDEMACECVYIRSIEGGVYNADDSIPLGEKVLYQMCKKCDEKKKQQEKSGGNQK